MAQLDFNWAEIERARYDPKLLFDQAQLDRLLSLPEGQHFDRKSARIAPRDLCKTICAFANSDARGGVVAVGFFDGQVEGFKDVGERKLNDLLNAPHQLCPAARCESKTVSMNGDSIVLFYVHLNASRVVELSNGDAYTRVGDVDRKLSPEEAALLRDDRGQTSVEAETVPDSGIDDLDERLLEEFVQCVREDRELEFDKSPEDILLQRRLGVIEHGQFRLRLAGLLVLGRDPVTVVPGSKVRFIRYEGTAERTGRELNVIKDASFEGAVPIVINDALTMILSQLREYRALRPDGRFDLVPEYPHDCVREAIVNACVHRSYGLRNQPVFVRMFDDRIEIESPGGFIAPVTAETVFEIHAPRNPFLMSAMQHLKLVRMANEGTRRMRHLMRQSSLPDPQFAEARTPLSRVLLTLHNDLEHRRVWIDKDIAALVGAHLATSLTEEETRVLNYLAENERMTVSDAFRITTVKTWHSARKIMDGLLEKGLVEENKTKPRDPLAHFVLAPAWRNGNGKK